MTSRRVHPGEVLFRRGEPAHEMLYLVAGRFRLAETGAEVAPGALVGELGFLAPDQARTLTLECMNEGAVLRISYDQVKQLYFQNPQFGFYLLRLASRRLFGDIAGLRTELAAHPGSPAAG